jgi:hypothetical protein
MRDILKALISILAIILCFTFPLLIIFILLIITLQYPLLPLLLLPPIGWVITPTLYALILCPCLVLTVKILKKMKIIN